MHESVRGEIRASQVTRHWRTITTQLKIIIQGNKNWQDSSPKTEFAFQTDMRARTSKTTCWAIENRVSKESIVRTNWHGYSRSQDSGEKGKTKYHINIYSQSDTVCKEHVVKNGCAREEEKRTLKTHAHTLKHIWKGGIFLLLLRKAKRGTPVLVS